MATGRASAATTRHGIEFDTVLNVVDDLGFDPNGNEPVNWKLEAAADDRTLLVFPEGEYLFEDRAVTNYKTNFGMLGKGNARFVVPEHFNKRLLFCDRGTGALFENIDVDMRADGATPGIQIGGDDDVVLRDVEFIGQGINAGSDPRGEGSGNPRVTKALYVAARASGGEALVENVVARNKGLMGAYNHGDGRTGIWVGRENHGTVTIRNCHFSEFPNNGLYTSRTHGVVQVEGGTFRNNDISQVRLGSEGSYVKNAVIEVDSEKSASPNPEDALNQRGVRIESGPIDTAGVTVQGCQIHIANAPWSDGGIVGAGPAGHFEVLDTRVRMDIDWATAIQAKKPATNHFAPPEPHNVTLRNVSITGDAKGAQAVLISSRPNSVVRDCCIEQTGDGRRGVKLVDSDGSVVRDSTLNVPHWGLDCRNTDADSWSNSDSGSCPLPDMSGGYSSPSADVENGGTTEGSSSEWRRLKIEAAEGSRIEYELEVDGELRGFDLEWEERNRTKTHVTGETWEHYHDGYEIKGSITKLVVRGKGSMAYLADSNPKRIKFYGNETGGGLGYTATADEIWKRSSDNWDKISEENGRKHVSGAIGGWFDEFGSSGRFHGASMKDVFTVTVEEMN